MTNKYFLLALAFLPLTVFAQAPRDAFDLVGRVVYWVGSIIPVLLGFIVIVIFWNLGQFILHAGDERERDKYKQFMIWGVVAVFLIVSFWGVVYAIASSFFGDFPALLENPVYVDKNGMPL